MDTGKSANNFAANIAQNLSLVWRLMGNSTVPLWLKGIPVIGMLYWLNPIDPLPPPFNFLPIDDAVAIFIALKLLIDLAPDQLVDNLRTQIRYGQTASTPDDSVYDAPYQILDDE